MSCSPSSKKLCGTIDCDTCYQRSFATHPRAKCWSDQNELQPIQVFKSSNKMFWFNCDKCSHKILVTLNNISNGQWCRFCNKNDLCEKDDCDTCYNKSFASHPMAPLWSSKNIFGPRMIGKGSEKKCWFQCKKCNHEYDSVLYVLKIENHCPYCANQKLCQNEDCIICFEKSCASHSMKDAWSSTNDTTPRQIFLQANKKIKFNCTICNHLYETTPNHYYNRDGSCSYCANKKLCEKDTCQSCFNKSFASHPHVHCWSTKNKNTPRSMFKGSETKCIFECDICHSEFESKLYNVLTGYWCPFCKNKSEGKMFNYIKKLYPDCKTQVRFDWCRFSKTNNIMPFDFGLLDKKILIELDGEQHFKQISNWDSPENVQEKDMEKIKYSIQQGYSIIHIYQVDVWKDNYDWKTILQNAITSLQDNKKSIIFISTGDKYNSYIKQLENVYYEYIHPTI